jgi:CheY-like chemotaxis protein
MPDKRVLVVDDDENIRRVLVEALTDEGYEVREAGEGQTALEHLAAWTPSVIILDLMMPIMDGWQFRERQLTLDYAKDIPVIILTALRNRADLRILGAAAVIAKPFSLKQVLRAVGSVSK